MVKLLVRVCPTTSLLHKPKRCGDVISDGKCCANIGRLVACSYNHSWINIAVRTKSLHLCCQSGRMCCCVAIAVKRVLLVWNAGLATVALPGDFGTPSGGFEGLKDPTCTVWGPDPPPN